MTMIGQKNNIHMIEQWRKNKSVPRFIIIAGDEGSGRLTIAKVIRNMLGISAVINDIGIDDVRRTIEYAYSYTTPTMYIFRDADDMSLFAKNALLKVVEEPPNDSYFVITVRNLDSILGTIRSRGTVIKMEPYSRKELESFCNDSVMLRYFSNIGQLKTDIKDVKKAEDCVHDVFESLFDFRSGTKLLKSSTGIRGKKSEVDKVDGHLFMRVFEKNIIQVPTEKLPTNIVKHIEDCKRTISKNSVNCKAAIECMLISILEDVRNELE